MPSTESALSRRMAAMGRTDVDTTDFVEKVSWADARYGDVFRARPVAIRNRPNPPWRGFGVRQVAELTSAAARFGVKQVGEARNRPIAALFGFGVSPTIFRRTQ